MATYISKVYVPQDVYSVDNIVMEGFDVKGHPFALTLWAPDASLSLGGNMLLTNASSQGTDSFGIFFGKFDQGTSGLSDGSVDFFGSSVTIENSCGALSYKVTAIAAANLTIGSNNNPDTISSHTFSAVVNGTDSSERSFNGNATAVYAQGSIYAKGNLGAGFKSTVIGGEQQGDDSRTTALATAIEALGDLDISSGNFTSFVNASALTGKIDAPVKPDFDNEEDAEKWVSPYSGTSIANAFAYGIDLGGSIYAGMDLAGVVSAAAETAAVANYLTAADEQGANGHAQASAGSIAVRVLGDIEIESAFTTRIFATAITGTVTGSNEGDSTTNAVTGAVAVDADALIVKGDMSAEISAVATTGNADAFASFNRATAHAVLLNGAFDVAGIANGKITASAAAGKILSAGSVADESYAQAVGIIADSVNFSGVASGSVNVIAAGNDIAGSSASAWTDAVGIFVNKSARFNEFAMTISAVTGAYRGLEISSTVNATGIDALFGIEFTGIAAGTINVTAFGGFARADQLTTAAATAYGLNSEGDIAWRDEVTTSISADAAGGIDGNSNASAEAKAIRAYSTISFASSFAGKAEAYAIGGSAVNITNQYYQANAIATGIEAGSITQGSSIGGVIAAGAKGGTANSNEMIGLALGLVVNSISNLTLDGIVVANGAIGAIGVMVENGMSITLNGTIFAGGYDIAKASDIASVKSATNKLVDLLTSGSTAMIDSAGRSNTYSFYGGSYSVNNGVVVVHEYAADDKLTLTSGSRVFGRIDLTGGKNSITIHGGAQVFGAIEATAGELDVTFLLNSESTDIMANAYNQTGMFNAAKLNITVNADVEYGTYSLVKAPDIAWMDGLVVTVERDGESQLCAIGEYILFGESMVMLRLSSDNVLEAWVDRELGANLYREELPDLVSATDIAVSCFVTALEDEPYHRDVLVEGGTLIKTEIDGNVTLTSGAYASQTNVNGGNILVTENSVMDDAIFDGANLEITSGGVAMNVAMIDGSLTVGSAGNASGFITEGTGVLVDGGRLVSSYIISTELFAISEGGIVNDVVIENGDVAIEGGTISSSFALNGDVTVGSDSVIRDLEITNGDLNILGDANLRNVSVNGTITVAADINVTFAGETNITGAIIAESVINFAFASIINFDWLGRTTEDSFFVNDLDAIAGANWVFSVSAEMETGLYRFGATVSENFDRSIAVFVDAQPSGSFDFNNPLTIIDSETGWVTTYSVVTGDEGEVYFSVGRHNEFAPEAPEGLTVAVTDYDADFTWDAVECFYGVAYYVLAFGTEEEFLAGLQTVISVNDPQFSVTQLANDTYYVKVCAIDSIGNTGAWSDMVEFVVDYDSPWDYTFLDVGSAYRIDYINALEGEIASGTRIHEAGVVDINGGSAVETYISAGVMNVFSGEVENVVMYGGEMNIEGGNVTNVTLTAGSVVMAGGSVYGISMYGNDMTVTGGEVANIDVYGGYFTASGDADIEDIRIYGGVVEFNDVNLKRASLHGGEVLIVGNATDISLYDNANLTIDGDVDGIATLGSANMYVTALGGSITDVSLSGGATLDLEGASIRNIEIGNNAGVYMYAGSLATVSVLSGGSLTILNEDVKVNYITLASGAQLTAMCASTLENITVNRGSSVASEFTVNMLGANTVAGSISAGSFEGSGSLNLVLSGRSPLGALIDNDAFAYSGKISITVAAEQSTGSYTLFNWQDADLSKSYAIYNTNAQMIGNLQLGSEAITYNGKNYALALINDAVTLNVTTAPVPPKPNEDFELSVTTTNKYVANLSWVYSGGEKIKGYQVTIDGMTKVYNTTKNTYKLSNVAPGAHSFYVRAVIWDGSVSDWSDPCSFVMGDYTPPKVTKVQTTVSDYSATFTITATDNVGVAEYKVVAGNQFVFSESNVVTIDGFGVGKQSVEIYAYDYAGNVSKVKKVSFTVKDVTPPEQVVNLHSVGSVTNKAGGYLAWDIPYDNVGVAKYEVVVNGKKYTTSKNTLKIGKLAAGEYSFTVVALDKAGNRSIVSDPGIFQVIDVIPPKISSFKAQVKYQTATLTWKTTDDSGSIAFTKIYLDNTLVDVTSGFSYDLNGIALGKHTVEIAVYDGSDNFSTKKASINVKAADPVAEAMGYASALIIEVSDFVDVVGENGAAAKGLLA